MKCVSLSPTSLFIENNSKYKIIFINQLPDKENTVSSNEFFYNYSIKVYMQLAGKKKYWTRVHLLKNGITLTCSNMWLCLPLIYDFFYSVGFRCSSGFHLT